MATQLQRRNTGVLRFAQDDDVKRATATADPYGMTNKRTGNDNDTDKDKDKDKDNDNGEMRGSFTAFRMTTSVG
jgi:hypothetical protein